MGADLITICVFGPKKLSTSKATLKKAEKRLKDYATLAHELEELEAKKDEASEDRLEKLMKEHSIESTHDVTWASEYKDDPKRFIDEFLDVWHNYSRDSSGREVPGQRKRKVWYAGEMTWGDTPSGYGYQTMWRADQCGLLPLFGLE